MSKKLIFIIGGVRCGKSAYALKEASKISGRKAYIATAEALDEEMEERIERHKRQRGDKWVTYEEPIKVADVIKKLEGKYSVIVIDCLTLWLSNSMHAGLNIKAEIEYLISSILTPHLPLMYIVSNEVGMGIVPENEIARKFRDMAGVLNQKMAEVSDTVYMMVSGIPIKIKDKGET
jgi:adenosylcobinamide kinase/adenosylcobinamide-phosphate guanylyltransferase